MKRLSTGNEYISIPDISIETGGIENVGFMHSETRACIELRGSADEPLLRPVVEINGKELATDHLQSDLICHWIPRFVIPTPELAATATVFAPMDRRGFVYALELENLTSKDLTVRAGWRGCWQSSHHATKLSRPIGGATFANVSAQAPCSPVIEFRGNTPLFAMALQPNETMPVRVWDSEHSPGISARVDQALMTPAGADVYYELLGEHVLKPSEKKSLALYVGIGLEETSAVASARDLGLQGWARMLTSLMTWLDRHTIEISDERLRRTMNVNSFYNYFYGQAVTLDKEELVMTSARSLHSDCCGSYRDRDAMRWTLPAVLQVNWAQARKMLIYAFTTQLSNVGVHSRFIDGIALEPGFGLDHLCAPLRALQMYLQVTEDMSILFDRRVQTAVNTIKDILMVQRNPQTMLFETLLTPSGELAKYPYMCYPNVLAWRILLDLGALYDRIRDLDRVDEATAISNKLRAAIQKHFVVEGPFGDMFARSIDLHGNYELADDPYGSLKLLSYLGFCSPDDGIYKNTIAWINSEHNPLNATKCISVPDIANDLLAGDRENALDLLRRAEMDDGIACEWIEGDTGRACAGKANAACAGYLAFALRFSLNAFLPEAAAVQKARKPTGTLYQPPPEMDQASKKARV